MVTEYFCLPSFQTTPTSEEIGHCDEIKVSGIGDSSVTIFKQGTELLNNCGHLLIYLFIYLQKQQEILGLLVGIVK